MTSKRAPSNDLRPAPGERLYRALLHLYPKEFRARYGEAMVEFYRDRWRSDHQHGRGGVWLLWRAVLGDLLSTVPPELLSNLRATNRPTISSQPLPREETMSTLAQDVYFALRGMARRPLFTAIVLATLALGIGANAAIFSVVNGILLRPLPFAEADRIVAFSHEDPYWSISEPEFMDYARDVKSLTRLAAYQPIETSLTGEGEPERVQAARVSDGFFSILGVPTLRGRSFTKEDDMFGRPRVAVVSYGLWQRRFAGDSSIVGQRIALNGTPFEVVGVMPPRFDFPSPKVALWIPLRLRPESLWTRNNHYFVAVGKMRPGIKLSSLTAEVRALDTRWMRDFPETYFPDKVLKARIVPITDHLLGATRPYLISLLGAVGFVLLIACVNVANLLLARGEGRRKELAIRTALGASRKRVVQQLLTESGTLALLGGAIGFALAWLGLRGLIALAPPSIPRLDEVRIDFGVLLFTIVLSVATGLLFGLVPALKVARTDSSESLKDGGKAAAGTGVTRSVRGALVVAEVALAVVMLVGAGLLARSLWKLQAIELGFDPARVLTMRVSLPGQNYSDARAVQYFDDVVTRIRAMPGVQDATAMGWTPLVDGGGGWSIMVDGRVLKTIAESPSSQPAQVTPGYFKTLGISIMRGRAFTEADRQGAPPVAVVNEAMARQLWPGQDPLGHTFKMFNDQAPWVTVVGVARDIRSSGFLADVPPTMFFPYAQAGTSAYYTPRAMTVAVRTAGDPMALAGAVRQAARALDASAPISDVRSMDDVVGASTADRRFMTELLGGFAALALLLAGIGIYGVIAYGVSQRTYEIGVRMALGAGTRKVMLLILGEGLRLTVVGLGIGFAGALVAARFIRSLLVEITIVDPLSLSATALVLLGVAAFACVIPARRASGVSPTEALRGG
jgi:putative ABC transport system permease protein